jgi:dephospho-CoA kinase
VGSIIRVGLTGGIGSGKSTVAGLLATCGASVIDADAIARELTAPGGLAMPLIASVFGPEFITSMGALKRDKMRTLIYADEGARERLEAIIHPLVGQETQKRAQLSIAQGHACLVFDIPLLVESATWRSQLDLVLVVDCLPETQIKRVMMRNQLQAVEIEKIMASQISRRLRLGAADGVIFNDDLSLQELAHQLGQIAARFGLSCAQPNATQTISA